MNKKQEYIRKVYELLVLIVAFSFFPQCEPEMVYGWKRVAPQMYLNTMGFGVYSQKQDGHDPEKIVRRELVPRLLQLRKASIENDVEGLLRLYDLVSARSTYKNHGYKTETMEEFIKLWAEDLQNSGGGRTIPSPSQILKLQKEMKEGNLRFDIYPAPGRLVDGKRQAAFNVAVNLSSTPLFDYTQTDFSQESFMVECQHDTTKAVLGWERGKDGVYFISFDPMLTEVFDFTPCPGSTWDH